jgi:TetR/AcrR family transcriptional regulator
MAQAAHTSVRASHTRRAILAAAEDQFATAGYAATRLEDVAERVGIRRASIVYYFKDKRALYEAVLHDAFGGLYDHVAPALSGPGPLAERIEAAVSAWVDYVCDRTALPVLLLREVADAARGEAALRHHTEPFFRLVREVTAESRGDPLFADALHPAQVASAVAGTSIFFLTALPAFVPELARPAAGNAARAEHRDQLLALVRRLLGSGAGDSR